jgi:hypothetical protein
MVVSPRAKVPRSGTQSVRSAPRTEKREGGGGGLGAGKTGAAGSPARKPASHDATASNGHQPAALDTTRFAVACRLGLQSTMRAAALLPGAWPCLAYEDRRLPRSEGASPVISIRRVAPSLWTSSERVARPCRACLSAHPTGPVLITPLQRVPPVPPWPLTVDSLCVPIANILT